MNNGDGFIRSLVNRNLEGFRREFESFLDQCPSFLYHVGTGRFLPVFFFSMFATAHDAGILAPDERVYIRFDNHGIDTDGRNRSTGNLKVAVLTNKSLGKKRVVRCYSISDVPNSDGLRFSEREKNSLVQEIGRENWDLREEGLSFEQYKVCTHGKGKSQGEKGAVVFEEIREKDPRGGDRFAKYSASEINLIRVLLENHELTIKEIEGMDLNQNQHGQLDELVNFAQVGPGQQRIDGFIGMLASNNEENTERQINEEILPYITRIYRHYSGTLENDIQNRNQKFESHAVLLGLLANFSHLYTIDIDLDLSPGNSYVAFLVRRQAERENIPIGINVTRWRTPSDIALNRARGDAKRLHASSFISIHTESKHAVCVGLNFNLRPDPFRVGIAELQQNRFPLVQRLFEYVEDEEIRENIKNFLLQHLLAEIPRNAENRDRILACITGFAFGNSAFTREYLELREGEDQIRLKKYIFRYDNEDLRRHALTMVFHVQGFPIVILDIRNPHDIRSVKAITLPPGYNGAVNRVTCILNNQYGLNVLLDRFNSPDHYLRRNRYASFDGNLIEVPNAENVHNTLNQVMNDGWQSIAQHRELLRAISRVLMPDNMNGNAIIDVSNNDKFRSILHGIFYVCDNPDKVVTEYRVGQTYSPDIRMAGEVSTRVAEQRLGLLLLRSTINHPEDTHPIGYVLGFANTGQALAQERRNAEQQITRLMDRQRGYLPITPGNEVVLFPIVFNRGANEAGNLILFPERIEREEYVHRFDRHSRGLRPGVLVGPESVIDENPPENLLSDVTSKRLIDYFQGNQKQSSIPLFNLGNNQWAAFRYLEGDKEQVIRKLRSGTDGTAHTSPTAQGILERINNVLGDGNSIQDVNDLITLDFATDNGYYGYWLQQHDMSYAARAGRYNFPVGDEMQFHIMGIENDQVNVLKTHIRHFKNEGDVEPRRSILIVNLGGNHWVTLVIDYRNGNYIGYYADSLGHNVLNSVRRVLEDNNVTLHNILIDQQGNRLVQQKDGYNCGFWALENARDINEVLQQNNNLGNQGRDVLDEMRNSLTLNVPGLNNIVDENNLRNEEYFKVLRRDISIELQDVNTNAGRARSDDAGNPDSGMSFIINNQNNPEIRRLLLEYLASLRPQLLHFNKEQQTALLQFVSSSFPNVSTKSVKQGLYLPSFEERGIEVNGKCVAITRGLSQTLFLQGEKPFLSNLETSSEIYERIAQGRQVSEREQREVFAFSALLNNFERQLDSIINSLPSNLIHTQSYKTLDDLSHYMAKVKGDFAIHLVTSNHVVAVYRIGDNYTYFDSNATFISELESVDQLMQVVEKGIEFAGYEMGEKGFLIEHFNVNQANDLLADKDKQTLKKEIQTERQLLAKQDKELGLIKINGQEVSRVQLYDFGTKINVRGSVPLLINADMKLNSEKFLDCLDKKEVSMTAREYLDNLKNSKNVKEVVQATKAIPFKGSSREVKEAEQKRSPELRFSMKQLIEYLLTAIINSKQKSQLPGNNSKADDNPNHHLSSITIHGQSKESKRYQSVSF